MKPSFNRREIRLTAKQESAASLPCWSFFVIMEPERLEQGLEITHIGDKLTEMWTVRLNKYLKTDGALRRRLNTYRYVYSALERV